MAIPSLPQQYRDKAPLLMALVVSSVMSLVIFAGRVVYSEHWTYLFLAFNLFLAWLPLCCALTLGYLDQRQVKSNFLLLALFGGW